MTKGRFAPSPSGRMHLGNVYTALLSWLLAKKADGSWLLRIEDLDRQRCKRVCAEQLLDDLRWLGLVWDEGPADADDMQYRQSARTCLYERAFDTLREQGIVYDCFCRRADLLAATAPHASDGTPVYAGRCISLTDAQKADFVRAGRVPAQRVAVPDTISSFYDGHFGAQQCNLAHDCGDFVVRRADGTFAYQLAVVVDDALMGVTQVARGADLLAATHQQLFLYQALGYAPPQFFHLPLLMSADGRRLSKRDKDRDMGSLRSQYTAQDIIGLIMWLCGFSARNEAMDLSEALTIFDANRLPHAHIVVADPSVL
ncbi:MAG: tRNA glutamyl-Q(34) synthetase GluQRS [Treponemataceae bacterium]|nr:tRNA glutamyl-Q(34) synthetase GluQRS [Treponemataceae bacterium]